MPSWKDQLAHGAGAEGRRATTPPAPKGPRVEKGRDKEKDKENPGSQGTTKEGGRKRKPSHEPEEDESDGKGKHTTTKDLLGPLARLTLSMALQVRQFEAHLRDSYQLATSADFIKSCNTAGDAYFARVKELGKGHGLGAPFVYIAQAGLEVLSLSAKSPLLARLLVKLEQEGPSQAHQVYTHFQVKAMYDDTKSLVKIGYQGISSLDLGYAEKGPMLIANIRAEVHRCLTAQGATQLLGPAPRGELERVVQGGLRRR